MARIVGWVDPGLRPGETTVQITVMGFPRIQSRINPSYLIDGLTVVIGK
jgi:hypothetical protein